MRLRGRLSARSVLLVVASLAGWIVLLTLERHSQVPICLSQASLDALASGALAHALTADPPALILLSCFAMVVAMMSPLLARPIGYLRLRSATSRRWRATTLFVASYLSVWIIVGMILLSASAALRLLSGTGFAAPLISLAIAAAWHMTPWRQHALNRCHHLPAVAAFGAAADRDCARFGVVHGSWCVLTCSPLMLLPLSAPEFHLPLMAAVAVALFLERMEPGRRPAWTIPNLPGRTAAATLMRSICSRARHAAAS